MKNGIQIEIQKDLLVSEEKEARDFADKFIAEYLGNGMKFKTQGGWYSSFRRGTVGLALSRESNLYIRRASKNRRIYQIVKVEEIRVVTEGGKAVSKRNVHQYRYGTKLESESDFKGIKDRCSCPKCTGQLKVSNKYGDTKTFVYATIGDIKG